MAKFRNDSGSVLHSEFGPIGPGEPAPEGYDPDVHGVIPGMARLDEPKAAGKAKADAKQDKEPSA